MSTYLVTLTCYGTWLHGDERGSVWRKGQTVNEHDLGPDPALEAQMRRRMKHPEMRLNGPMRKVVREAIEEHCRYREWVLHAINVRTNHAHMVIGADVGASRVLNSVKARATRCLRDAGLIGPTQPVWAERGNRKHIESAESLKDACHYVLEGQGADLPDD